MIGEPYRWQCEADRCYRQRDRAGRWHAGGRDMGTDDPGEGNRYHPECRPALTLGLDGWVIRSDDPDPLDGEPLYWSNADGWVDLGSADRFDSQAGTLPIGGRWEAAPMA